MTIHPDAVARQKMLSRSESQTKHKEAVKAETKNLNVKKDQPESLIRVI